MTEHVMRFYFSFNKVIFSGDHNQKKVTTQSKESNYIIKKTTINKKVDKIRGDIYDDIYSEIYNHIYDGIYD